MPDFLALARRHLKVRGSRSDDMRTEMANHLEERHHDLTRRGLTEDEATRRTLELVPDWNVLSRALKPHEKRETMSIRKTVLVPGIAGTAGAAGLVLIVTGLLPASLWASQSQALQIAASGAALCVYAGLGAVAAAWSRRNGGTRLHRFLAAGIPLVMQGTVLVMALASDALTDVRLHTGQPFRMQWGLVIALVLLPGLALLGGTLPFLDGPGRGRRSRDEGRSSPHAAA